MPAAATIKGMANTPVYALPYQGLADAPNGPTLGQQLALAVEAELVRVDADIAALPRPILVASDYQTSGDTTVAISTAAVHQDITFTAVAGEVYTARWIGSLSGTVATSEAFLDLRHAAGTSVTTASTAMGSHTLYHVNANNNRHAGITVEREFTATASGNYTVGFCINFFGGSGSVKAYSTTDDVSQLKILRTA